MATLRLRPVTGIRGGSWVSNPRRTRATRVRRRRCNGVGAPRGASGPLTTGMCEHDLAGCHRALGCLGQGGDGRILIHSPNVRTCAQTKRGHWMPAVSPLLVEGYEDWFRQPYSRVRKPRTATVSAALTPHIAHEQCHRVDHPPRSHRRHVPTRTTLPIHLRRTRVRGASRRSGQPDCTHHRLTVGFPRVGLCVALGE